MENSTLFQLLFWGFVFVWHGRAGAKSNKAHGWPPLAAICSLPAAAACSDGYLLKGNVVMELIKLLENITFDENKPVLRTLLPGPGPRVMLLYLHAGQSLPEHAASDTITVQALSGWTTFYDGPVPFEMKSGTLLRLEAGRPHALIAQEDSVLLVTVLSRPESKGSSVENSVLDLRSVARGQRHPLVFARVSGMAVGESFTIVNDHDPQPLRRQLELQFMDEITWDYLERGPEAFRVCIARVRSPAETSGKASLPGALAG